MNKRLEELHMTTKQTYIEINGLRIEHSGGDSVVLTSPAPSEVRISDLLAELTSLRPETSEEVGSSHHIQLLPDSPLGGSGRKAGPE